MEKEYVTLNSGSKTAARSSKNTKSRRKTGHSKSNIRRSALETKRTGSSRTGMRKVNGSSKSTSPRTSRSKKKSRSRKMDIPVQYIAGGAVLVILLIAIIFAVRSCGISHKTPERVVKALIESYESGNENKIKKCYGVTKADDNLQAEIDANILQRILRRRSRSTSAIRYTRMVIMHLYILRMIWYSRTDRAIRASVLI